MQGCIFFKDIDQKLPGQNGHLTENVTDDQLKEKLIELQNLVKDVDENNKPRLGRRAKDEAKHNS